MVVSLPEDDLSGSSSSSAPQNHCFTANICIIQLLRLVRLQIPATVNMTDVIRPEERSGLPSRLCECFAV